MHPLLKELFTTDVGILSSIVIAITLCMAGYYAWYFRSHMNNEKPELSGTKR